MVDRFLVDEVRRDSPGPSPLDRIATAAAKSVALTAEADALIDHFVAEARRAGHSWTEIGVRLGVTKQAVRERFADRVPIAGRERFMPRLQRCVDAARDIARSYGAVEVTSAHLLIALAANEGVAASALDRLGVTPDKLATASGLDRDASPMVDGEQPRESAAFADALRAASSFALDRGHGYVGTEHLLFVLATDPGASTRRALENLGVTAADVKRELEDCLGDCKHTRRSKYSRRRSNECRCSFCGSSRDASLAAGPGVYICGDCARLALEVIAAKQ